MIVVSVYKEHPVDLRIINYKVGVREGGRTPVNMVEHEPIGVGDIYFVLVWFDNSSAMKICNPDYVEYDVEMEEK